MHPGFAAPFLWGLLNFPESWFSHLEAEDMITASSLFICAMMTSKSPNVLYCSEIITSFIT